MSPNYNEEIRVCEIVIDKLNVGIRALEKTVRAQKERKMARHEKMLSYKTIEDAQEAYAYGMISEEEYDDLKDLFDGIEKDLGSESCEETALGILKNFRRSMEKDVEECRFRLLPKEEQHRIIEESLGRLKRKVG